MPTVIDELVRLAKQVPEEELVDQDKDLVDAVAVLRAHAELKAEGHVTPEATRHERLLVESVHGQGLVLRWPHMGPGAVGAAILVGWTGGVVAGPLGAIVGAVVGLVGGDQLDQHVASAET